MSYVVRHPENLGAGLVLLGVVGFVFRKRIAEWRAPPAESRIEAVANREMVESLVKWCSIALVFFGVLLTGIYWLLAR